MTTTTPTPATPPTAYRLTHQHRRRLQYRDGDHVLLQACNEDPTPGTLYLGWVVGSTASRVMVRHQGMGDDEPVEVVRRRTGTTQGSPHLRLLGLAGPAPAPMSPADWQWGQALLLDVSAQLVGLPLESMTETAKALLASSGHAEHHDTARVVLQLAMAAKGLQVAAQRVGAGQDAPQAVAP